MKNVIFICDRFLLVVFLFVILAGCSKSPDVELALYMAGENKGELEKVLDHFPKGAQKREAAVFLLDTCRDIVP